MKNYRAINVVWTLIYFTFQLLQPLSSRPRKTTCVTADHVPPNNFPIYRAIFWFYCAINEIYRAIKKICMSSMGHCIPTLRPLARFARGLREVTPMRGLMTHSYSSARELLHHWRRAGIEKTTQIWVVSGETAFILHIETYNLKLEDPRS